MKLNLVAPRQGMQWIQQGLRAFWKQPLAMAGLFFTFLLVFSLLAQLPIVGVPLVLGLLPAITLGLMVASKTASSGQFPMPTVLLSAFRAPAPRPRHMLVLGGLYGALLLGALGLSMLFDGGQFANLYFNGPEQVSNEVINSAPFRHALWFFTALSVPLSMMFWHAPGLVYWHGVTPVKSLFFSAVACLRNIRAFIVYVVSWLGVFLLANLVIVLLSELTGWAIGSLMLPTLLILASMFFTSIYFSFHDCFWADEPPSAEG